ncbi:galactolipase DONGLE, chloroplastic-like [Tripterygium wilfordii]|nr:galactolipase DONGLE, chloroplastic-like [Tripterygium wilfordii]
MAAKVLMPNSHMNHITSMAAAPPPRSHSFGKVSLPVPKTKKPETHSSSSSRHNSIVASFVTPSISTTISNENLDRLPVSWREIHGSNDWEGLVEPLHPHLQGEIIRYGEFVNACYKAFDLDSSSKRYLNCKYGKNNLFSQVGLGDSGYQVTKYIYATPDINIPIQNGASCGRWIGYAAVSSDEETKRIGRRDILITFRGTVTNHEWIANFMSSLSPTQLDPHNPRPRVKVESGFLSLYTSNESDNRFGLESCREQLLSEVSRLMRKYKGEEMSISLVGHSMGSSLALLLAYDIAELGLNRDFKAAGDEIPVAVFSFGGPRVGNLGFKKRCEELGVRVLRIVNVNDPITKLPGVFLNDNFRVFFGEKNDQFPWSCSCYAHVGVELVLDFFNMHNPSCVHDLETYISLLKSPKNDRNIQKGGRLVEIFDKAKDLMLQNANKVNIFPRKNSVIDLVSLVQNRRNRSSYNIS